MQHRRLRRRASWGLVVLTGLAVAGCRLSPEPPAEASVVPLASVDEAFQICLTGDVDAGIRALDTLIARSASVDGFVSRGLCHWARWDDTGGVDDARRAYLDLTAAIEAVEGGEAGHATPLHQMYSHRAFVARALDDAWVRTLEDLDRAVDLAPRNPTHVLDRGVVRSYAGDTAAARTDFQRFLVLADSGDVERRAVVRELIDSLGPAPTAAE